MQSGRFFSDYCGHFQKDPFSCDAPFLCNFLLWLFMRHSLKPITIRGYLAALARIFNMCYLPDCTKDVSVQSLLSNFDIECPRSDHRLFPKWDIHVVLEYLQSDDQCDLQNMSFVRPSSKGNVFNSPCNSFQSEWATCIIKVSNLSAMESRWFSHAPNLPAFRRQEQESKCRMTGDTPLTDDAELCPVTYLSRYLHLTVDTGSGWPSQPWRAGTTNTTPQLIATSLMSGVSLVYQTAGVMNAHSEYVGSHAYKFWVFWGLPFSLNEVKPRALVKSRTF